VFVKHINLTLESCDLQDSGVETTTSVDFEVQLDSFHDFVSKMTITNWLPVYVSNTNWTFMEFVCKIEMRVLIVAPNEATHQNFKYVLPCLATVFKKKKFYFYE
jgi:hypothetical protein